MKKENVLVELLAGILAFGIAMQIIALVVFERDLYNAVGLWTGIGVAVFMAIHMKRSLEDAIDLGEENAGKHARNAYVQRTIITLVVIGLIVIFNLGNPIAVVIGIFPLKLSAYLQPYTHKFLVWLGQHRKA